MKLLKRNEVREVILAPYRYVGMVLINQRPNSDTVLMRLTTPLKDDPTSFHMGSPWFTRIVHVKSITPTTE
jgi:hypothetical protein